MSVHSDQVCEWRSPEQLKELLDLELRDKGESESRVLQYCRDAIKYSVKTSKLIKLIYYKLYLLRQNLDLPKYSPPVC